MYIYFISFHFLLFSVLLSFKYLPSTNMILFILSYIHTCSCAVHSIWIWRKKKYERVVLILCSLHMNCSFCLSFCCLNNADILFLYLHHSIHIFCFLSAYFFFCIGLSMYWTFYLTKSLIFSVVVPSTVVLFHSSAQPWESHL